MEDIQTATVCVFLRRKAEAEKAEGAGRGGVGGGHTAGENLAHSLALKPLKATVLFSMEVLY